jgi:hypothetical protein
MRWHNEASPQLRAQVATVMRNHAARAREQIAQESVDPSRPDFEIVSRVMQESQTEIAAELRDLLPQKDFEALFPPELEHGVPSSTANPTY